MKTRRMLFGLAALSITAGALQQSVVPTAADTGRSDEAGIEAVRGWTARYQDEAVAIGDGFLRTDSCVPGMGYHYVNPDRFDTRLEPSRPEVLIYVDDEHGNRQLVAAEWVVVDRDQDVSTDDDRPRVFGRDLEGPMVGHEPGMPVHYDLHAWAWLDNPAGAYHATNPQVACGGGGAH